MRAVLCSLVLVIACDRGRPPDAAPPVPPAAAAAPRAPEPGPPGCTLAALPLRLPAPRRVVAIGDLHGDLGATRAALRTAGAIDEADRWVGGPLVVVQTGDVLDRGDDERAILDLIARLETEARAAGGAFVMLLGNHELMNAAGDFRYVTPAGLHAFDGVASAGSPAPAEVPEALRSRVAALGPGGPYARRFAQHAVIAIVGDTVFSHAGVLGDWVTHVEEVNQSSRCWLDGQLRQPPRALDAEDGPVWTRAAGAQAVDCGPVSAALDALGAKRMVVGHTVQDHGITSACDDRVWRIDVGLARRYGGPIQVLELVPGEPPRVLTGARQGPR
ncbi:MAG TPA: metallophosphoesterase [Kofleriaceae bacterium]|nr:metallophosphoesterase [Kofleriaceae bacterium]